MPKRVRGCKAWHLSILAGRVSRVRVAQVRMVSVMRFSALRWPGGGEEGGMGWWGV